MHIEGYLGTFREFVESLKRAAISPPSSGPVDVNYSSPAVDQLWDHVKGVITACNSWLKPFMDRFGIKEGNGLCSLVLVSYETPKDLCDFIVEFFKAPAKDKRDSPQNNPLCDDEQLLDVVEFDDEPSIVDENGNDAVLTAYRSFVESMTGDEKLSEDENTAVTAADDNNDDTEIATATVSLDELDMTNFFETTTNDADEVFIALKELLQSDSYGSIQEASLKLMEYMDLARLEKGSLHFDTKRKSFQQRWMSIK
jgi:hypothetical protein